ncbi:MAG: hypothetical protein MJE77_43005 [Proteobacteria bacterium]|nr:hypothetical protein [Pseudomonadota bacterium]
MYLQKGGLIRTSGLVTRLTVGKRFGADLPMAAMRQKLWPTIDQEALQSYTLL